MIIKAKRIIAMSLASAMTLTMFAGCSNNNSSSQGESQNESNNASGNDESTPSGGDSLVTDGAPRQIYMGTWYEHYYTSAHQDVYANAEVSNIDTATMQLENMRAIEERYNIEFYCKNMTWDGVIQSINTSILAGTPDVDVYEVDLQFGVPAVLNNYAQAISSYAPAEDFEKADIVKALTIGDADEQYLFKGVAANTDAYMLAFNMDMINDAGLENPQDLYDRGEWTWDKWLEYLQALTQDTDGDGATDVYGYGGWWTTMLTYMLMSNSTDIAATGEEHLSDPRTQEVLEFIYDMYNTYKVARPWDESDWNINDYCYTTGEVAFWISAHWIASANGDADPKKIPFEVGYVPWPTGPSATDDVGTIATAGNWYFIPNGVSNASQVYHVMYDFINWYDGDLTLRDDTEWAEEVTYSPNAEDPERNFRYLKAAGENEKFDIWGSVKNGDWSISMWPLMNGEQTAAQYIEENKQLLQDALDGYFN